MIDYIGEHVLPGNLGRLAVIVSFTASLLTTIAYLASVLYQNKNWKTLARISYYLHSIAVFSIVGILFYIMHQHYFEYDYVWKHSSLDLAPKYLFAAFWEGQEGSFLLWMFWHAVLGLILMNTSKEWEARVMPFVTMVQAFLASMLLGVYVFGVKIGSNPFVLIRQLPENIGAPWTSWPDYLEKFPAFFDGKGLNPLLQNYWMTIHPPTLFLGFAATLIPFAFAMAGLISKKDKEWIKPVTPWTLFGVSILGTGILMGGAWAYEALSFGGFWAWDPVENTSLVPWLILVSALHLLLIQRVRGNVLVATYLFSMLAFILTIYSSFLTRSGLLGDTSVHAFVDLGLNGQLLIYLLFFTLMGFGLLIYRYKSIPKKDKNDDNMSSKEFWIFIGALILLISGLQITASTSLPIFNDFFGPNGFLPLLDKDVSLQKPIQHFNSIQVPFAIVITLLMGIAQYLSYKETSGKTFMKRALATIVIAFALSIISAIALGFFDQNDPQVGIYTFLLFTGFYAVMANLDYWIRIMKGSKRLAGSSVAHIGFGLIMIGALISNYKQHVISENAEYIHKDFPANENLVMEINDTLDLATYKVAWRGERKEGNYRFYDIDFKHENPDEQFTLSPSILRSDKMDMNSAEPSTKHYWFKDIYTHITYADLEDKAVNEEDWTEKVAFEMKKGDEIIIYNKALLRLDTMMYHAEMDQANHQDVQRLVLGLKLTVTTMDGKAYETVPFYVLEGNQVSHIDATIDELGYKFRFEGINVDDDLMKVNTWKYAPEEKPFIIIKATVFPFINVLWLGCILMGIGSLISMVQRIQDLRKGTKK